MFAAKNNTSVSTASPSISNNGESTFIQPKLNVGKPGDKYEVEADKAADQIVAKKNQPTPFFPATPTVQKQAEEDLQQQPVVDSISSGIQLKENPLLQKTEECQPEDDLQMMTEEASLQTKKESENHIPTPITNIQPMFAEDVQTKEEEDLQEKEEDDVQTLQKQTNGDEGSTSPSLENNLSNSMGGGSPLTSDTRNEMESGFGKDFSGVRVHNDSNAVQMNQELGAQAFTSGNDVYFNEGKYNPSSDSGKHLLAHELTHTVQQGASVQAKMIQKTDDESAVMPNGVTAATENNGTFNFTLDGLSYTYSNTRTLGLPLISVSDFKDRNAGLYPTPLRMPTTARNTNQREVWRNGITTIVTALMNTKIQDAESSGGFNNVQGDNRYYFFKGTEDSNFLVFGTRAHLLELAIIPTWNERNAPISFQVDHILEHQLGGGDTMDNFELLEASANASSGSSIMWEINKKIQAAWNVLTHNYYQNNPDITTQPNIPLTRPARGNQYANLFRGYNISFANRDFNLQTQSGDANSYWSYNKGDVNHDIDTGAHLNKLEPLTGAEVEALGHEDDPSLFTLPNGGVKIDVSNGVTYPSTIYQRVQITQPPVFEENGGSIEVNAYKSDQADAEGQIKVGVPPAYSGMTWQLGRIPNTYIYYIDNENAKDVSMRGAFQSIRLPGMSPIRIDQLELNATGFFGSGKVLPTVPLIRDADIDIIIDGDSVRLRKLFTAQEFDFPSPFTIDQATLEVSFGTDGLGIVGRVGFGINNVGTGFVGAAASTGSGFTLEGEFNFDSELFDPAKINFEYKDEIWTIGGEIGIPEGKIPGVKSATITASYSENTLIATGDTELDIPGIQRGTMNVLYNDEGFSIGGEFQLKDDIPGIRGGNVSATISKQNGEDDYSVMVSGTAQPDVPGIETQLSITYDNGALTIEGNAAYNRGMLSGNVQIGATNKAIGDDGQPTGDPDDTMRVYGGGSLTLGLAPWLEATAGVKFLPNGEIEVTGRIGVPDSVDIFDRKSIDKNLFNIPAIEIPIFAIPLGPRSIGIVARITGGLDFSAGFGPGQIRDLYADVTYNPDREDETTITGHGEFVIPADAGLTMRGDLGLGVSIGIASLTGGIEVAGSLGLEGEALAQVDVNWSPQTGLAIDALGCVTVNPKFTFDINAFARASLDLWLFSISETWRYNIASFSWGPDIQFGIEFPVNYTEGEPFDMSFDDINVIYPEMNVGNMIKGIARDKKDDIF